MFKNKFCADFIFELVNIFQTFLNACCKAQTQQRNSHVHQSKAYPKNFFTGCPVCKESLDIWCTG